MPAPLSSRLVTKPDASQTTPSHLLPVGMPQGSSVIQWVCGVTQSGPAVSIKMEARSKETRVGGGGGNGAGGAGGGGAGGGGAGGGGDGGGGTGGGGGGGGDGGFGGGFVGGGGGEGGEGGGNIPHRGPQSVQSMPSEQRLASDPGPPSLQKPLDA